MQVTYLDWIGNYWFTVVTKLKVNKPIKVLGTMASIKIENSTLIKHLQMPLTTQSKFNYLYNISTLLEWKNISSTVYKAVLIYHFECWNNPLKVD